MLYLPVVHAQQLFCLLCIAFFVIRTSGCLLAQKSDAPNAACVHDQVFDFEISNQKGCFHTVPPSSGLTTLSSDTKTVKHGKYSLKWEATVASKLQLRSPTFTIPNKWLRRGGIKVWFYKEVSSPGKMLEVMFKTPSGTVFGKFKASLDFEGWRAIWIHFNEFKLSENSLKGILCNEVNFVVSSADTIYIDLLEFIKWIPKTSRDKIVPPVSPFGLNLHDMSHTWQHTYKWSQQAVPMLPSQIDKNKEFSLQHINSRLRNWYCDERKTSTKFLTGSFLEKRWNTLLESVKVAHKEYDKLIFDGGRVVGPPLFGRVSAYGKYTSSDQTRKFGFIMGNIILPLALEYYVRSRSNEVTDVAIKQLPEINSGDQLRMQQSFNAIAGEDIAMQELFQNYLSTSRPLTQYEVETAIKRLNLDRLNKINNLLDFVKQQGFTDGSGLGSLRREMIESGAGFMHTLFLLSESLSFPSNKSRLLDLISTAKWYSDFGEIYQSPTFEYKGSNADRIITLILFRLMIVMTMPSDKDDEIKAKIRDIEALVRWMNSALSVNDGLADVIKPDFTGYHHRGYLASAYVPPALHTAALVQYLLGGTEFSLSPSSINNIRRGLETLRLVAVKYSIPKSVNGRSPHYFNNALINTIPAYAYISISHHYNLNGRIPRGIYVSNVNGSEMFLRLMNDSSINKYLGKGKIRNAKYYLNSLGSLDIMDAVKSFAASKDLSPEQSPEGHWSKNFAALSIHRRKDWSVTVKGFNRYVWDYECSLTENVYGLFASHGALLVANSEIGLKVHNVKHGWDWAKVPGATTIALGNPNIEDLNIAGDGNHYNGEKLAGGLTFKGTMSFKNGLFGMSLQQPDYKLPSTDWRQKIEFKFLKSVFFWENLLVCLGSNIVAHQTNGKVVQTTLFQDMLFNREASFIMVDGVKKNSLSDYNFARGSNLERKYTTLTDAKGNFYYIPNPFNTNLKVAVQTQTSKTEDGRSITSGRYGTAWFQHETIPSSYEYAVLIPTISHHTPLVDLTTAQETAGSEVYRVLQKDTTAHVVQFLKSTKSWSALSMPITGYVIFKGTRSLPADGPVEAVSIGDCLIMAEETAEFIYLSVSSPDLNFNRTTTYPLEHSGDVDEELLYRSVSKELQIQVTLRNQVRKRISEIQVHGSPDDYKPILDVDSTGKEISFRNLKNGFSVEVKFIRI